MKKTMLFLTILVVIGTMSMAANATTGVVNLWLTNPTATTYEVYAQMDSGGFGISLLGFDVSNVTSISNWMPYAKYMDPDDNEIIVGLGFMRSQSTTAGVGHIEASQDGISGTGVLIAGMGQTPGDLTSYGGTNRQPIYGVPLLVAKGNRSASDPESVVSEAIANYYINPNFESEAATVVYGAPAPPTTVPEPSSMLVLGSGVVGLLGFLRRRKG